MSLPLADRDTHTDTRALQKIEACIVTFILTHIYVRRHACMHMCVHACTLNQNGEKTTHNASRIIEVTTLNNNAYITLDVEFLKPM